MPARDRSTWPVLKHYDQNHVLRLAMPIGGIGTGCVSLGGRGNLQDFELVNRPAKGFTPRNTFFALWAKPTGGPPVTRVLESLIHPTQYEGYAGSVASNHSLPRFRHGTFAAAYPLGQVTLTDPLVPLNVRLEAFNPLIPADPDASGLPLGVLRFVLTNRTGRAVEAAVCASMQNFIGSDGSDIQPSWAGMQSDQLKKNRNAYRAHDGVRGIVFRSDGVPPDADAWGTLALATTAENVTHRTSWADFMWGDALLDFWDDFDGDGKLEERDVGKNEAPTASLAASIDIPANASRSVTFVLAWHFPNRRTWSPRQDQPVQIGQPTPAPETVGNHYCTHFADAWDAILNSVPRLEELEHRTVQFVRAFVQSDLPEPIKDAALANLSTLRSPTCFRTADGRFYGFEGCDNHRGCCPGSCTHVWNYEQATAFLFGSLSRGMREVEFLHATDPRGLMSFRVYLPLERATEHGKAAADGQVGCIVKLYRDWRLSGDDSLLRRLWPQAKKSLEFCWIEGGWDADRDGVMEGCQHNTMDVEYYGPNPHMTVMYLAALKCAQIMASAVGDDAFATTCATLFDMGRAKVDAELFNGQYYEHHVVPITDPSKIADGLSVGMGAKNLADPESQIGPGCEINQLFGQQLAHVAGLGHLLDVKKIRTALRGMMKFNFRADLLDHFNHLRSYALNDEGGVLMCTWPRGGRPRQPFPYANEVWTGLEYMLASHLLYEGMHADALKIVATARARHDGAKRNPFNEPECGHHYARAMSSWACVIAASGFQYDGVEKFIRFAAAKKASTIFWSSGDAWGTIAQKPARGAIQFELKVLGGRLSVERVLLGEKSFDLETTRTLSAGQTLRGRVAGELARRRIQSPRKPRRASPPAKKRR